MIIEEQCLSCVVMFLVNVTVYSRIMLIKYGCFIYKDIREMSNVGFDKTG